MSRRSEAPKRTILPDPKFGSERLAKFVNMVMKSDKKAVAERIVYGALDIIETRGKGQPMEVLEAALDNVSPSVEVKSRRVGGATYQVPVEVRPVRRSALAMRWIIDSARKRGEQNMTAKLAGELMDAAEHRGTAIRKREDVHRMAEANKAFAHYRW